MDPSDNPLTSPIVVPKSIPPFLIRRTSQSLEGYLGGGVLVKAPGVWVWESDLPAPWAGSAAFEVRLT